MACPTVEAQLSAEARLKFEQQYATKETQTRRKGRLATALEVRTCMKTYMYKLNPSSKNVLANVSSHKCTCPCIVFNANAHDEVFLNGLLYI